MEVITDMKFSQRYPRGEGDARKLNTHSAEKVCCTTLDDKKYDICYIRQRKLGHPLQSTTTNRMSVLVTALCNQFEAFTGDDQSRYLFIMAVPSREFAEK